MTRPAVSELRGLGPGEWWVPPEFFDQRVQLTWHALEQFAERAQPPCDQESYLRMALRDLALAEGRAVPQAPVWARSRNVADLWIQVGRFLLLICRHDDRRPGGFSCVTVVNGRPDTTWAVAMVRGWIRLPPPPPRPAPLSDAEYRAAQHELERSPVDCSRSRPGRRPSPPACR
jgi:hypothetical protein